VVLVEGWETWLNKEIVRIAVGVSVVPGWWMKNLIEEAGCPDWTRSSIYDFGLKDDKFDKKRQSMQTEAEASVVLGLRMEKLIKEADCSDGGWSFSGF
jgi:hypothetical protein